MPTKKVGRVAKSSDAIDAYTKALPRDLAAIGLLLRQEIEGAIPAATSKIWHGAPVWFLEDHPILGFSLKAKNRVSLLFWNGQAFDEPALKPAGKFKAAELLFESVDEVSTKTLRRQFKKAKTLLWDYEGIPESRRPKLVGKAPQK